ncbi:uncharacterized protein LACBIDRAFT_296388 [Laccaria bicolor S238N-H82]|uniref:Predicted protein n=1 Tax=Laccaria bicolor (strain S238N-H82 / ATCC MYA-4686) TaxID=486041 RepID=B0D8P1_LACBS|nr:uncharacterized protein LACBIDRAFT_296388 [Laccaria bicolor S238N-H82]EDR08875.1 predicted protein [Laccaria bicolor S238N-H82]|eukprot:XP_001880188.1 predicted protein [Laccaria bicolor S238N-H82]
MGFLPSRGKGEGVCALEVDVKGRHNTPGSHLLAHCAMIHGKLLKRLVQHADMYHL